MTWLVQVIRAVDHVQIIGTFPWSEASAAFRDHGYAPRHVIRADVVELGRENSARDIISFAVSGMQGRNPTFSRIPPYILSFIKMWLVRFAPDQAALVFPQTEGGK